jgi:hypothetical protein
MTTLKLTARYARHLLTSLATIGFGVYMNEPTLRPRGVWP